MESENVIFLILFFSVISCLWGWTAAPMSPKKMQLSGTLPSLGGSPLSLPGGLPVSPSKAQNFENLQESLQSTATPVHGFRGRVSTSFFLSSLLVLAANLLLTFFLLARWFESGHPPFSNLYESLLFLAWALLFFYFPATTVWGAVSPQNINSEGKTSKVSSLAGMLLVSAALFIYTFATWILPSEMREIKPLVPALKSNWLLMHVSIMLLSYSALLAGSLFCIMYLVIFYSEKKKENKKEQTSTSGGAPHESLGFFPKEVGANGLGQTSKMQFLSDLDALSYRSLAFAFPLLTLGIISGAVWANEAWGSYWSWDPKETWALITWFTFSIYLHLRIQKSWEGEKAALVGSFGFCVIWICYLGVNLLGKGLHSYGWWNS